MESLGNQEVAKASASSESKGLRNLTHDTDDRRGLTLTPVRMDVGTKWMSQDYLGSRKSTLRRQCHAREEPLFPRKEGAWLSFLKQVFTWYLRLTFICYVAQASFDLNCDPPGC